eukprot:6472995-Amphidinium_carterae.1
MSDDDSLGQSGAGGCQMNLFGNRAETARTQLCNVLRGVRSTNILASSRLLRNNLPVLATDKIHNAAKRRNQMEWYNSTRYNPVEVQKALTKHKELNPEPGPGQTRSKGKAGMFDIASF